MPDLRDIMPPPGQGLSFRRMVQRELPQARNVPIDAHLYRMVDDDKTRSLDTSPDYQRAHVWTSAQAEAFVGAFAEGDPMPAVFIREGRYPHPDQVVDGKQRLSALLAFVMGEIGARLSDGRRILWADFDVVDRRGFLLIPIPTVYLAWQTSDADVLRIYLRINRGGTPHTEDDIARVRAMLDKLTGGGE